MKLLSLFAGSAWAANFYFITIYAPEDSRLDAKVVNAYERAFVVGVDTPSTRCGLKDPKQCPDGTVTLVDEDMSILAAAVPGGQSIYVLPDGLISYSLAHSAARPPGSQVGGFYVSKAKSDSKTPSAIVSWRSGSGSAGLWTFTNQGCLAIPGLRIEPAGSTFGAWEYL